MRLSSETVAALPPEVVRPGYDREGQKAGVVHFGIGAFHRAHQAVYFDEAMKAGERDWSITGVSLRSSAVAEQMNPQDGLFTVAVRSGQETRLRLIGAVQRVLVATEERATVVSAIAADETQIITFTITEKGYCRAPDGTLDPALAHAGSVFGLLRDGLAERVARGGSGLTLLSCDNLAHNGRQLESLLLHYLDEEAPETAAWVRAHCTFPSSMVDRIVPATTADDLDAAQSHLGLRDEAHVGTEAFSQWVIEDRFAGQRPRFEDVGVELVQDVAPYETAKLRMLNGAHSLLAYLGLRQGHDYVHQAIADPAIRAQVMQLMRDEAAPSIKSAPDQDLGRYADALVARFANPALNHRLSQIAMDGSQKLPQRWLETLAWHQREGRACPAILAGIGAWLDHVRGDVRPVEDPLAAVLAALWAESGAAGIVEAVFGAGPMASGWTPTEADKAQIAQGFCSGL